MKQFYWGNSVSSMQTEGAWNEDGKGMSVYDVRTTSELVSDWKVAVDSYHRHEEDFDLMKDLGMNMYRFQISWSRVCPTGDGEWNMMGIEFYDKFIDGLISRGIEPMICLYHFDMPLELAEKHNGFHSKEATEAFIRFGKEMVDRFSGKVKHWLTFNEQNIFFWDDDAFRIAGYIKGKKTIAEKFQIQHNTAYAHASIANYIHNNTDALISGMVSYYEVYPATSHPTDVRYAREADEIMNMAINNLFVNGEFSSYYIKIRDPYLSDLEILDHEISEMEKCKSDYLSFSYYYSTTIDHTSVPEGTLPFEYVKYGKKANPTIPETEWGWQIDPEGFRGVHNKLYNRFKLPLFPIENGIGVNEDWDGINEINDSYRIDYHRDHLLAMFAARDIDGVPVLGYLGWGLIDILSSTGDMRKRYGVVFVNRDNHDLRDLARVPKKSYQWLKSVIESNGGNLFSE